MTHLASPLARSLHPVLALTLLVVACGGDPSASPDGGPVGATADAAPALGADEVLRLEPPVVTVAPGLMVCVAVVRELKTGATIAVDPHAAGLSLRVLDPTLAVATDAGDCPGLGVLGLAAGATAADVTLTEGATSIWSRAPTTVVAAPYTIRLAPQVVARGSQALYAGTFGECSGPCPELVFPEVTLRDAQLVPHLLQLDTHDHAIATVAADPTSGRYLLTGVAAGVTELAGSYASPGGAPRPLGPVAITVPASATLDHLNCIDLRDPAAAPTVACGGSAPLHTGDPCVAADLVAQYHDPASGAIWLEVHGADATWQASGTLTAGAAATVCPPAAGYGDGAIRGCLGGQCTTLALALHPASVAGFDLTLAAPTTITGSSDQVCGAATVRLHGADGVSHDVTGSAALQWDFDPQAGLVVRRATDDAGQPLHDARGRPCFLALTMGGSIPSQPVTVTATLSWGEVTTSGAMTFHFVP